jgi:hypothetical protein
VTADRRLWGLLIQVNFCLIYPALVMTVYLARGWTKRLRHRHGRQVSREFEATGQATSQRNRKCWRGEVEGVTLSQERRAWREAISRILNAPRYRRRRQGSGDERSGKIGERLVDHRLGRFHGSGYACHQKRRSGKASDEARIGPKCFPGGERGTKKGTK